VSSPIWDTRADFCYSQTVMLSTMWNSHSEERTSLSFTIAADHRYGSHSMVPVLRDSWPCFTISDSRIPKPGGLGPRIYVPQEQCAQVYPLALDSFSSSPTTHRAMVAVFDPASTPIRLYAVIIWNANCKFRLSGSIKSWDIFCVYTSYNSRDSSVSITNKKQEFMTSRSSIFYKRRR
jgi:hypothetical protein